MRLIWHHALILLNTHTQCAVTVRYRVYYEHIQHLICFPILLTLGQFMVNSCLHLLHKHFCSPYFYLHKTRAKMTSGPTTGTTPPPWPGPATPPPPRLRTLPPISMSSSPPPPGSSSMDNTSWCPLFRPAPAQQLRGRQANVQKKSCCWPIKSWPSYNVLLIAVISTIALLFRLAS